MSLKQIRPDVYQIALGVVNAYLLKDGEKLVLIDTGVPGSTEKIVAAVRELGCQPDDIQHILLTHLHGDHTGSLPEIKKRTQAPAYMHSLDADWVARGAVMRAVNPAPGIVNQLIYRLFMSRQAPVQLEPTEIEHRLAGDETLDFAGGLQVIFTPGHAAGHLAFLKPGSGGLLFVGDAASNMMGLGYPPIFEDLALGQQSLAKLSRLAFETACFGHGAPIEQGASQKFAQKWGAV